MGNYQGSRTSAPPLTPFPWGDRPHIHTYVHDLFKSGEQHYIKALYICSTIFGQDLHCCSGIMYVCLSPCRICGVGWEKGIPWMMSADVFGSRWAERPTLWWRSSCCWPTSPWPRRSRRSSPTAPVSGGTLRHPPPTLTHSSKPPSPRSVGVRRTVVWWYCGLRSALWMWTHKKDK